MKENIKNRIAIIFAIISFVLIGTLAHAQQTSIDNGLFYLYSTQNPDGSWGGTATSLNSVFQTTATTARTLQIFGITDISLTNATGYLSSQTPSNIDDLARQIEALSASGMNVTSQISSIKSSQQADGGWGIDLEEEYTSNTVDTISAFSALKTAGAADAQTASNAINFLLSNQNTDGGFGITKGSPSEVFYTSLVLQVLVTQSQTTSIANATNRAINFLVAHQNPDGSFGSVFETALAYSALVAVTTDATVLGNAVNYITKAQSTDGSWGQDAYSTALSLQALFTSQNKPKPPPAPTTGTITGTVIDGGTNQPLSGVIVSLTTNTNISTTTTGTGSFSLASVPQGPQQISLSLSGYTPSTITVSLSAGSITNIGAKTLFVSPTTGIIQGTVTDAQNGSPLSGVTITVTGTQTLTAVTAIDGSYKITDITPGTVTLSASKTGYLTISGTGTVVAGGILIFSPSLSTTKPTSTTGDLKGTVLDSTSGKPIMGASITMTGVKSYTTTSGIDGAFTIPAVDPGSYTTSITASGYTGQSYMVSIFAGITSDLGLVRLDPILTQTIISGRLTDAKTGNPISAADILITGTNLTTKTGLDGTYTISGITQLEFSLKASKSGYDSKSVSIKTASYGAYTIDINLNQSKSSNIAITALTTDKESYPSNTNVAITATMIDISPVDVQVHIGVKIKDAKGELIDTKSLTPPTIVLVELFSTTVTITWNTKQFAPGGYSALFQITDVFGIILTEQEVSFNIEPTISVTDSAIRIIPISTHVGAVEDVTFGMEANNRSNIQATFTIEHEIKSPSGAILDSGATSLATSPEMGLITITLSTFNYSFTEKGDYPIQIKVLDGANLLATVNGAISSAPAIRIDPVMTLTPNTVVPDGDKRIRVNIHLKGVEKTP